jgi:hypothetical protein
MADDLLEKEEEYYDFENMEDRELFILLLERLKEIEDKIDETKRELQEEIVTISLGVCCDVAKDMPRVMKPVLDDFKEVIDEGNKKLASFVIKFLSNKIKLNKKDEKT